MYGRRIGMLGYAGLAGALFGSPLFMPMPPHRGHDYHDDRPRRPPRLGGGPCEHKPTGNKRARRRAQAKKRGKSGG